MVAKMKTDLELKEYLSKLYYYKDKYKNDKQCVEKIDFGIRLLLWILYPSEYKPL